MSTNDIESNRRDRKWTPKQQIGRVMWAVLSPLFSLSPRPFWGWRRQMLRWFGASIGANVHVFPTVKITIPWNLTIGDYTAIGDRAILYALGPITIGERSTISQYSHICAGSHDYEDGLMTLTKPPITIGSDTWVCADTFIGPDVTIGDNCVIGARSVVVKDAADNSILGGNPAKLIKPRTPAA